jgi:hypothetical protein
MGFTLDEWRMGVRYLRVLAVHQGEGSLLEWLERVEPPRSYDKVDWKAFIHAIMPEIRFLEGRGYLSSSPRGVMSPAVELPIRQLTTATPDTLQMAEESLTMPCQPDETGSAAARHMGAVQQGGLYTPPPFLLDSTRSLMDYSDSTRTPLGLVHLPTSIKLSIPVQVQSEWSPSGIRVVLGIPRTGHMEFTGTG